MDFESVVSRGSPNKSETFYFAFLRKISIRITWLLARTNLTPNHVTIISFICSLLSAAFFIEGTWTSYLSAVIFLNLSLIFDCVDGELARVKSMMSRGGALLDEFLDRLGYLIVIGALTWTVYQNLSSVYVWLIGFAALGGPFLVRIIGMKVSELNQNTKTEEREISKSKMILRKLLVSGGDIHVLMITISAIFNYLILGLVFIVLSSFFDATLRFAINFKRFQQNNNIQDTHP